MKRQGSIILEVAFIIVLAGILIGTIIPSAEAPIKSASNLSMENQSYIIDNALYSWYSSHKGEYPDNLSILQEMRFISSEIDLNNFDYALYADKSLYRLTYLKNGKVYKSVGSTY